MPGNHRADAGTAEVQSPPPTDSAAENIPPVVKRVRVKRRCKRPPRIRQRVRQCKPHLEQNQAAAGFRTVTAGRLLEAQGNLRSRQMVMSAYRRYQNPAYRPIRFFIRSNVEFRRFPNVILLNSMNGSSKEAHIFKRKSNLLRNALIAFSACAAAAALVFSFSRFVFPRLRSGSVYALSKSWKSYDYESVYEISKGILSRTPFNNAALTYHGYAAFYLGVSSLDKMNEQNYLDEAINSLRLALLDAQSSLTSQLFYMLGKAYFYKNTVSSYYYADLAVKYLELAKARGYKADDIAEYLGLSYAALGMTMESISSFTEALLVRESDMLLFSIAEQYYKAGQNAAAEQYLFRVIKECDDENLILQSRMLLGSIYIAENKYEEATEEFLSVLEKDENSADAHYQLGILYEKQGDMVKARAEWRNALRIQVNHRGALEKMAD